MIVFINSMEDLDNNLKATFIKFRDMMMNNHTSLREALSAAVCGLHGEASRLAKRLMRQL